MVAPAVPGTGGGAAASDDLAGSVLVCVSVIAMAEVGRRVRHLNLLLGAWLVVAPVVLDGYTAAAGASSVVAGLLLVALSRPRGTVRERYGSLDRCVR